MKVTSIDELKKQASGELVELPPFVQGQSFIARLRRPSLMKMVAAGKIPNTLMATANALFSENITKKMDSDETVLTDVISLMEIFAEAIFVEPSWNELQEAGIELTDEQYLFLFSYSQQGIQEVEPFRGDNGDI